MRHVRVAAHRGIHYEFQENTIKAIKEAEVLNVEMVEFDVHQTSDGIWVLHHDEHLERGLPTIADLRYDQLLELAEKRGITIDTLEDLLKTVSTIHLNIECKPKSRKSGRDLAKFISNFDYRSFNISSFSAATLVGVRDISSNIQLSYLGTVAPSRYWKYLNRSINLFSLNPMHIFMTRNRIKAVQDNGLEVHVWTINRIPMAYRALHSGVDVIITDDPIRIMKLRDFHEMHHM